METLQLYYELKLKEARLDKKMAELDELLTKINNEIS